MVKELTAELRLVLERSVEVLSLIEACRTAQPKLSRVAETFIKIIQVVLPFTYEADNDTSVRRSLSAAVVSIPRLLDALRLSMTKLKCSSANHFGIHRPSLLVYDIILIEEELNHLISLCSDPTNAAVEAGLSYNSLEMSVNSDIECSIARLWWSKRIGADKWCVDWSTFAQLFQEDYGEQPPRAIQKLYDALCKDPHPLVSSPHAARHHEVNQKTNETVSRVSGWTPPTPRSFAEYSRRLCFSEGKEDYVWLQDDLGGEAMRVDEFENEGKNEWGVGVSLQACSSQTAHRLPKPVVTVSQFNGLTRKHDCFYDAFQSVADPNCIVYAMGAVDDYFHSRVLHPIVVEPLLGVAIVQVCCGGQHLGCLSDAGEVYTWGLGGFGRLGHGTVARTTKPRVVEWLRGIHCKHIACGFAYTASVTQDGKLYMWGAGENGRLGLGDTHDRYVPSKVPLIGKRVTKVSPGSVHTCVLLDDGSMYSFGKHEYTGHDADTDVLLPREIPTFENVRITQVSVGPGGYHTIALDCSGIVYTWGHNRVGQLGYDDSGNLPRNMHGACFLPKPQPVPSLSDKGIIQVISGWGHSAALSKRGQVFVCGRNVQGQLGLGNPGNFPQNERGHHYQAGFRLVSALSSSNITHVSFGGEHSVAITEDSEVYTFGSGHKGQLGHGTDVSEHLPRLLEAMKNTRRHMLQASCGNNCTLLLAGGPRVPSLYSVCLETLRKNRVVEEDCDMFTDPQVNE